MDIKNTSQILAQNLKELRKNKGISTEKLSQKIKELYGISISADSLANYEVDDQHHTKYLKNMGMRVEYLQCLSDFYGVTVDYLLGNTKDPSPKPCAVDVLGLSTNAIEALEGKHTQLSSNLFDEDDLCCDGDFPSVFLNAAKQQHVSLLRSMVNILLEDERTHDAIDSMLFSSYLNYQYFSKSPFLKTQNNDGDYIFELDIVDGKIVLPPYTAARSILNLGRQTILDVIDDFFDRFQFERIQEVLSSKEGLFNGKHHTD